MNSSRPLRTLCLCLALLAVGCAYSRQYVPLPDQSKTVENPELARIYVLRPQSTAAAFKMPIWDGESKIGKIGGHGFLCWERPPGDAEISCWKIYFPVRLEKGNVYYVLLHQPALRAMHEMGLLSLADGQATLRKCDVPQVRATE